MSGGAKRKCKELEEAPVPSRWFRVKYHPERRSDKAESGTRGAPPERDSVGGALLLKPR